MTFNKEIMILSSVFMIFLLSLKVVYGMPITLEEVLKEEREGQTSRPGLQSYIFNHNISLGISDVIKTAFNISADWIPLEKLMRFAETPLLEISVREHMQRCEGKNEGDVINYTISNTVIQFPNRSGVC